MKTLTTINLNENETATIDERLKEARILNNRIKEIKFIPLKSMELEIIEYYTKRKDEKGLKEVIKDIVKETLKLEKQL